MEGNHQVAVSPSAMRAAAASKSVVEGVYTSIPDLAKMQYARAYDQSVWRSHLAGNYQPLRGNDYQGLPSSWADAANLDPYAVEGYGAVDAAELNEHDIGIGEYLARAGSAIYENLDLILPRGEKRVLDEEWDSIKRLKPFVSLKRPMHLLDFDHSEPDVKRIRRARWYDDLDEWDTVD